MSKTYFTNRHGKKLSVEGAGNEAPEAVIQANDAPAVKTRRHLRLRIPGRAVLVVLAAIVALLLIGTGLLLISADGARREYDRQGSALQSKLKALAVTPSSTETSAVDVVKGLLAGLQTEDDCTVDQPAIIVDNYPPAQRSRESCRQTYVAYQSVAAATRSIGETAVYLEKQHEILAPALARPANEAFAEIGAMNTQWDGALIALRGLEVPPAAESGHTALLGRVEAVAKGWQGLAAANAAQQREAFTAAEADLTKAYEGLRVSNADFTQLLSRQQTDLTRAVKRLTE